MFWFSSLEACEVLAPSPGIKPMPPALEGKILTTGPPGKSWNFPIKKIIKTFFSSFQNFCCFNV